MRGDSPRDPEGGEIQESHDGQEGRPQMEVIRKPLVCRLIDLVAPNRTSVAEWDKRRWI